MGISVRPFSSNSTKYTVAAGLDKKDERIRIRSLVLNAIGNYGGSSEAIKMKLDTFCNKEKNTAYMKDTVFIRESRQ